MPSYRYFGGDESSDDENDYDISLDDDYYDDHDEQQDDSVIVTDDDDDDQSSFSSSSTSSSITADLTNGYAIVEYDNNNRDDNSRSILYNEYDEDHDYTNSDMDENDEMIEAKDRSPFYMKVYDEDGRPELIQLASSFLTINNNNNITNHAKCKKRRRWWLYVTIVAIMYQFLLQYGPPTPPSDTKTLNWYQYGFKKGYELLLPIYDISFVIVPYVTQWCWTGLQYDIREYVWKYKITAANHHHLLSSSFSCTMRSPDEWNNFWETNNINNTDNINNHDHYYSLIGQTQAQKIISQALDSWKATVPPSSSSNNKAYNTKALTIVLSGTVGVGKKQLVTDLSHYLSICNGMKNNNEIVNTNNHNTKNNILVLDGSASKSSTTSTTLLLPRLKEHVMRYTGSNNNGIAIIIIHHPEDMTSPPVGEILEEFYQSPRVLILTTTHVGSKIINKRIATLSQQQQLLQQRRREEGGGEDSDDNTIIDNSFSYHSPSMDWDLREELDLQLDLGISKYITAVAPFGPLGPTELQGILMEKVKNLRFYDNNSINNNNNNNVRMTLELAKLWTSPKYIEYYESKLKNAKYYDIKFTFSSQGAKFLETHQLPILRSTLQSCHRQARSSSFSASASQNCEFIIDSATSFVDGKGNNSNNNKGVIRACCYDDNDKTTTRTSTANNNCNDLCYFDL